ncbi:hybrid sensor histidine kinase/response regulator [Phormidesmis priestleyi ULC007]|uniref:Circadian input-output histidine kinase CikA n=1 Tax=Phormidesmis priestleyi ULC007 TaxID=1920490 RepID=A0A2T1DJJ0_9CYAN|nr:ATP-binding protein [Phormidesmis priestleyi]PSB20667.1 hybrid sensor histidine kinase/response regulator [Phormidesmis priestleyi ULC007]PZO54337.1 MAG: hybrid sensor histidine kinase/response regulator [Phormidesmis priestleyi]
MTDFWSQLFSLNSFVPHGHCYLWQTNLVSLHVLSDALIALAYYSIPITLFYLVRKRQDLPFEWVFLLFAAFIVACGTTHVLEIWTLWYPTYWLSGLVKAFTALVSVVTATQLFPLMPKVLALPSPAQLEHANLDLQSQVTKRLRIEEELKRYQTQLESLVAERTHELTQANQTLQQEIAERKRVEAERKRLLAREQSARAEAEQANRIKDEFLAVLSHELRTPLNPIIGWSKLLQSGKLDRAKSREALETIERNAKLQVQLIDDLLDVSRILSGKLSISVTSVDLNAVIAAAMETLRLAAEAKALQIQTTIPASANIVTGDAVRLQQVVWNLLSNAIKFTPTGGQIEVSLTQADTQVQIQIKDTGKGILADFLPYVFDHFRQQDGTTTRKFGGLGLGLAISRQIVELHGGRIGVESPGENQGATFTVELPVLHTPNAVEAVADIALTASDDRPLANLRVLVVDDEPDSREFVAFVVEQAGAEVIAVDSAIAALQTLQSIHLDILLSDIGMPEMDGYALMRQVRQLPINGQIPAIALTAYAGEVDQQQAIAAGFQTHLSKPVEPADIVATVIRVYGRK